jgi:hypothetical protein
VDISHRDTGRLTILLSGFVLFPARQKLGKFRTPLVRELGSLASLASDD